MHTILKNKNKLKEAYQRKLAVLLFSGQILTSLFTFVFPFFVSCVAFVKYKLCVFYFLLQSPYSYVLVDLPIFSGFLSFVSIFFQTHLQTHKHKMVCMLTCTTRRTFTNGNVIVLSALPFFLSNHRFSNVFARTMYLLVIKKSNTIVNYLKLMFITTLKTLFICMYTSIFIYV